MTSKRKRLNSDSISGTRTPNKRVRIKEEPIIEPPNPQKTEAESSSVRSLYEDIVSFNTGSGKPIISIHKDRLFQHAPNFVTMIATRDNSSQIINLTEEQSVIERFAAWIYNNKIILKWEQFETISWSSIFNVYIFGERYKIPRLQNICICTAIKKEISVRSGGTCPGPGIIKHLWTETCHKSSMRRLILEIFARNYNLEAIMRTNQPFLPAFLEALVLTFFEIKEGGTMDNDFDFWKERGKFFVFGENNPIRVD